MKAMDRRNKIFLSFTVIIIVLLAVVSTYDYLRAAPVKAIRLFDSSNIGSNSLPLLTNKSPYPKEVQRVLSPGDVILIGIIMDKFPGRSITFSRYCFYNQGTQQEKEIRSSEMGTFKSGQNFIIGNLDPLPVPVEPGIYEFRIYMGNRIVASAVFEVGYDPGNIGPPGTGEEFLTGTIYSLGAGENAALLLSTEEATEQIPATIIVEGQKNSPVGFNLPVALEDGYYQLLLESPDKYFREPRGYSFMVYQSRIVNPMSYVIEFRLIPPEDREYEPDRRPTYITGQPGELPTPPPGSGEIQYRAEMIVSLSALPKEPPP